MKSYVSCPIALLVFAFITCCSCYQLTILHTNDVHGRIDEAYKYGGICSPKQSQDGGCVGGSARLYTKIEEVRQGGGNVLLLDGGDQFQGTFWFTVFQGQAIAQFMRRLGYDAMAIGNHEFDSGLGTLQAFITNVTASGGFSVLSANINNDNEPRLTGYQPYVVKLVRSKKIGIVGYTTTDTPMLTSSDATGKLVFKEIIQSLKDAIVTLKTNEPDVDIIIALGHAGFDIDKKIAKEVDDVNIVVGGHSNTFLWTGDEKPAAEAPQGEYPHKVRKNNGKTALCVQAYTFTKYLGNLSVTFDDAGDITGWSGNPILLDNSVPKDSEIEQMMEPYRAVVIEEGEKEIAKAVVRLDADCRVKECNMGNLIGDSWIHSNLVFGSELKWSRAAIVIINGGSIRAPIEQGNITYAQLLTAMPFGNDIVSITVSGATLKDVFENSASAYKSTARSGAFLQTTGAQVKYNFCNEEGNKVVDLKLRCLYCDIPTYEPLDPKANYTVLTSTFLAGGGDGYTMLKDNRLDYENLGLPDASMVENYMATMSVVYPDVDGRIEIINDNECSTSSARAIDPEKTLILLMGLAIYSIY